MRPPAGMAKLLAMGGVWVKTVLVTPVVDAGLVGAAKIAQASPVGMDQDSSVNNPVASLVLAAPVTPLPPPAGAPTLVSVTPGNGWLRAEFVAPVDTGGTPGTGYQDHIDGGFTWASPTVDGAPVTIVGLRHAHA